jgi:DnaJ-domain-containing protein 1
LKCMGGHGLLHYGFVHTAVCKYTQQAIESTMVLAALQELLKWLQRQEAASATATARTLLREACRVLGRRLPAVQAAVERQLFLMLKMQQDMVRPCLCTAC